MTQATDYNAKTNAGPIGEAAAHLEIKEFDLFALAHRWWFGRRPDPRMLERVFAAYMFAGVVPPWARQFARETLRELLSAAPDLARLGLDHRRRKAAPRHGGLIVMITVVVFALLYALILDSVSKPAYWATTPAEPTALSCQGGGPGLKFFEGLAHTLAGRDAPDCSE